MLKRVIIGGILGGIVLFLWGYFSWMALPWHKTTFQNFKDEAAVTQVMQKNTYASGIYLTPSKMQQPSATPIIFASVYQPGMTSMTHALVISFVTQLVAALLVSWLLIQTIGLGYVGRVAFVVIFALAAAIVTEIPYWNWFRFDTTYTLVTVADLLIGWFFAGLIIAGIARR
jgi:hypothetical protein